MVGMFKISPDAYVSIDIIKIIISYICDKRLYDVISWNARLESYDFPHSMKDSMLLDIGTRHCHVT